MAEFGALLKQAREDRGLSLRQIAATTKISMVALEALERDDFSRLPGGIFSRAFVRAYALEVGLEPDQTVATFIEEYDKAASMRAQRVTRPEVTADDRAFLERQRRAARILRAVLIAFVLIVAGAFVLWQARTSWHTQ
jgi:cytoskeletal protein RodZ